MQGNEGVQVWRGKKKPQRTRDPLAVIRPLLIVLRDRPVSAEFYEGIAALLDSFTRDHEIYVAVPEREATKDNISTVVHSAQHAAEQEGWLRAQGEGAADEELVFVVAHGVEDQSLAAAVVALPSTAACCATVFLCPRVFPRAAFSIGRPSAPSLCIATEASHYRVCLHLMESCAHLAACNGVDATLDLRPCVIVAGAHHWQLMPPQTYNNREVKRPKRGVDTVKMQREVATALIAFVDVHAKRLLPKARARQVLLSRMQLSAVLMSPGLWAAGLAGSDLILEQTGGEVILHRAAHPLHLPSDYGPTIQLAQPGRLADLPAIPSLVGSGPRHGPARDEALDAAVRRGAATFSSRRTQFVATICRNLQQAILDGFLSGDTMLERQLDLHPGSLLKLRTSAHDKFKVNVSVFESAAGFLRDVPDARLTTTGEVEIQVRCYLHQPDSRWHVPDHVDPDDPDAVAAAEQHRRALRTAHGDGLPPEELWVKVCRFDALASLAKRFILPTLAEISPIPLHELRFEDSRGSDWSWTEYDGSDANDSLDVDGGGGSDEGSLYEEMSEDALGEDALAVVEMNSARPAVRCDAVEAAGSVDAARPAGAQSNATEAMRADAPTASSSRAGTPPAGTGDAQQAGRESHRRDAQVNGPSSVGQQRVTTTGGGRRRLLRKLDGRGAKRIDERHRILRRRGKPRADTAVEEDNGNEEGGDGLQSGEVEEEVGAAEASEGTMGDGSSDSARPRSGLVRTYIGLFDSSSVGVGSAPGAAVLRPVPPSNARRRGVPAPSGAGEPGLRTNIATSSPEWRNPVVGPCKPGRRGVMDRLWREGVRGEEGAEIEFVEDFVTRLDVTRSWLQQSTLQGGASRKTVKSSPRSVLDEEPSTAADEVRYAPEVVDAEENETVAREVSVDDGEGSREESEPSFTFSPVPRSRTASEAGPAMEAPLRRTCEGDDVLIHWSTASGLIEDELLRAVPEERQAASDDAPAASVDDDGGDAARAAVTTSSSAPRSRSLLSRIEAREPASAVHPRLFFNKELAEGDRQSAAGSTKPLNSPRRESKEGLLATLPKLIDVPPLWKSGEMPSKLLPTAQINSPRSAYSRAKTLSEPARLTRLAETAQQRSPGTTRDRLATARDGSSVIGRSVVGGAMSSSVGYSSPSRWSSSGNNTRWSSSNPRTHARAWHLSHRRSPVIFSATDTVSDEKGEARLSHRAVNNTNGSSTTATKSLPSQLSNYMSSPRQHATLAAARLGSGNSAAESISSSRVSNFQVVTKLRALDISDYLVGAESSTIDRMLTFRQPHPPSGLSATRANKNRKSYGRAGDASPSLASAMSRRVMSASARSSPTATRSLGAAVSRKSVNFGCGVDNNADNELDAVSTKTAAATPAERPSSSTNAFGLGGRDVLRVELSSATVTGETTHASLGAKARERKREKVNQLRGESSTASGAGNNRKTHRQKYSNSTRLLGKNVERSTGGPVTEGSTDDLLQDPSLSEQYSRTGSEIGGGKELSRSKTHKIVARTEVDEDDMAGALSGMMSAKQMEKRRRKLLQDDADQAAKIQSIINLTQLKRGDESVPKEITATYNISPEELLEQPLWEAQAMAETLYSVAIQIVPEAVRQFHTAPSGGSLHQLSFASTSAAGAKQLIAGPLSVGIGNGRRMEVECPGTVDGLIRCPSLGSIVQHIIVDYNMACLDVEALEKLEVTIH